MSSCHIDTYTSVGEKCLYKLREGLQWKHSEKARKGKEKRRKMKTVQRRRKAEIEGMIP